MNGVDYFLRRLETLAHQIDELDELRICAIGEATAERLTAAMIHVDLVPEEFKAEGVFEALQRYLGGVAGIQGLNFLIPRAQLRVTTAAALEQAGRVATW